MDFWANLFNTSDFPPRWQCGNWTKAHAWLHILSDLGIWGAYFAIPCFLAYFVLRRKDIPFRKIFHLFVAFIVLCGLTHLMEAIIFWYPAYRLAGVTKFVTAVVSWGTVVALVQVIPGALAMRSPEELEQEITARKKAEQDLQRTNRQLEQRVADRTAELAAAQARTESVLNHVLDGIINIDAHGTVTTFNPAAESIFGYDADEVIGQNVKLLMPEPYQHEHDNFISSYLQTGEAKIIGIGREVEGRRKDGITFPMDLAVSEFTLNGKRYFTGIVRDISKRKHVEDQLRQIAAELSEANRRKDQFLATLAHELRNPLAPISTGLEVMKMVKEIPEQLDEVRETMERQTQQLVTLVDDLLDVSRITRGKLQLRKCRVRLDEAIQSAVEAVQPVIDEANHHLTLDVPGEPMFLEADPNRLAQVFSNLLSNAAKYTPEGGSITLSARRQASKVVVSVKDSGIGIPEDKVEEIFDMFHQIDHPLQQMASGLGIGLTLVKSLVEMHDGDIEVHSEGLDKGTEFSVQLPILSVSSTATSGSEESIQELIEYAKCRVLVVDDNKSAADMLSQLIKMFGNETRTASDGQEAIRVAENFQPDIVFMDIGMPRMNGYEAARCMRQRSWGQQMMLVALTGWGQDRDKRQAIEAGFDHHLVKPAHPSQLQELLAKARRESAKNTE